MATGALSAAEKLGKYFLLTLYEKSNINVLNHGRGSENKPSGDTAENS